MHRTTATDVFASCETPAAAAGRRLRKPRLVCAIASLAGLLVMPAGAAAQTGIAYILGVKGSPESQVVTVVDASTNTIVTTIQAGAGCGCLVDSERMAVSRDGSRLYVANRDTVSIINTATNTVVDTIAVNRSVDAVAISPTGGQLYVSTSFPYPPAAVLVVDTATKATVASIPFSGGPHGMVISQDGSRIYLAVSEPSGSGDLPRVKVIDTAARSIIATIDVGPPVPGGTKGVYPLSLDLSPDGSRLYMSELWSSNLTVIATATNTLLTTVATGPPVAPGTTLGFSPRVTPDGTRVYLTTNGGTRIVSTQTLSLIGSLSGFSNSIAFTPDGSRAFLGSGALLVLNTATNATVATIPFNFAVNGSISAMITTPPTRIMSLSRSQLNFNGVRVGTTASATLTIGNSGNSPMIVSSLEFPADFSANWAGGVIPPGGAQNVNVLFSPKSPQPYEGTVTVNVNETSGPTTFGVSGYGTIALTPAADFDGDRKADVALYRPGPGTWHILKSATSFTGGDTYTWGGGDDIPVAGDYDGDSRIDVAVYRPSSAHWFILRSGSGYTQFSTYQWGTTGDVPVPADFDGDGRTDIAIYRPSTGGWYILRSSTNYAAGSGYAWGAGADVPVPADYDGDSRADVAVYRPASGHWFILKSSTDYTAFSTFQWGTEGDVPVPGDYDGDAKGDLAVYRPSTGFWYIRTSASDYTAGIGYLWGAGADVPVPGDYDGDGRPDLAVFRPSTGHWFVLRSSSNFTTSIVYQWGTTGDMPVLKRP